MTKKKNAAAKVPAVQLVRAGDAIGLNHHTPCGLFQSHAGNRYIITNDFDCRVAIALAHRTLRPFTCQALCEVSLEDGRWCGLYRLRPIHRVRRGAEDQLGILGVGDRCAMLSCRSTSGRENWVALGCVGEKGLLVREYDGWIVEAVEGEGLFFEKSHRRTGSIVLDVQAEPHFGDHPRS